MSLQKDIPIVKNERATEYFEDFLYDATKLVDAVSDIASPDATDLASVITLANELKAQFNDILSKMRTAGKLSE